MSAKISATPRLLSKSALNRAVAKQRLWVEVDPATGKIVGSATSRRRVRAKKTVGNIVRQVDVRVIGVRA